MLELANDTGLGVGDGTLANGTRLNAGSIRMTTSVIGSERIRFAGGTSLSRFFGDVVSLATVEVTGDANSNLSPVNRYVRPRQACRIHGDRARLTAEAGVHWRDRTAGRNPCIESAQWLRAGRANARCRGMGRHMGRTLNTRSTVRRACGFRGRFAGILPHLCAADESESHGDSATVQYLLEAEPTLTRTYPLEPSSRYTIDIGADQALREKSFGMTVTFDQPGTAERSMYFGTSPLWKGGHESVGLTAPATSWFLAEGATGTFFETFVLLANPNPSPVTATLTYLPADGQPVTREKSIPANGRLTINIEQEDASLSSAAVATTVSAEAATRWGLAEGRVGGSNSAQTYILLANPQFDVRTCRSRSCARTARR